MGKRYYCEYCDKGMVSSPSIIKTHVKGVVHQQQYNQHYQQYKDPEVILNEESAKKPCSRFFKGICQFGAICRFSHYTQEQINDMKEYVATRHKKETDASEPSFEDLYRKLQDQKSAKPNTDKNNTLIYDSCGVTHVLPWTYNTVFDNFGDSLPPSIKRLKADDISNACFMQWGWNENK